MDACLALRRRCQERSSLRPVIPKGATRFLTELKARAEKPKRTMRVSLTERAIAATRSCGLLQVVPISLFLHDAEDRPQAQARRKSDRPKANSIAAKLEDFPFVDLKPRAPDRSARLGAACLGSLQGLDGAFPTNGFVESGHRSDEFRRRLDVWVACIDAIFLADKCYAQTPKAVEQCDQVFGTSREFVEGSHDDYVELLPAGIPQEGLQSWPAPLRCSRVNVESREVPLP